MKTALSVKVDDDGFITIPEDILESAGWMVGDMIEWIDREDGSFELRKTNES